MSVLFGRAFLALRDNSLLATQRHPIHAQEVAYVRE
jgi:hypothetical protein